VTLKTKRAPINEKKSLGQHAHLPLIAGGQDALGPDRLDDVGEPLGDLVERRVPRDLIEAA